MKSVTAVLLGMMVMGTSAGVWASGSAPAQQLDMKASLTSGTCTVSNKDAVITYGEITKAEWDNTAVNMSVRDQSLALHVDCSANGGYKNVHMTPTFDTPAGSYETAVIMTGSGVDSFVLRLFKREDHAGGWSHTGAFQSGSKQSYPLVNNMADINMYPGLVKGKVFAAGDFTGIVTLDFDFD